MVKRKNTLIYAIIAVIALGLVFGSDFQFSVTGNIKPTLEGWVGVPQFSNARCQAGSLETIYEYDMEGAYEVPNSPRGMYYQYKEFECSQINTKECIFDYNIRSTIGEIHIYKVPISTKITTYSDFNDFNKIVSNIAYVSPTDEWKGGITYNFNSEFYKPTEKIIVMASDVPLGGYLDKTDLSVRIRAQKYDLDSTTDSGLRNAALNTCDLSKIYTSGERDVLQKDLTNMISLGNVKQNDAGKYVLAFDRTSNYISSLRPVVETQDIIKRNGIWVWVKQPKEVCPIEPSPKEFGNIKYYADCRIPIHAPEIICTPATPNCAPDGTRWLEGSETKTCNWYGGGLPSGYYPNYVDGKPEEYCIFTCEGGVVKTHSCVTITDCDVGYKFSFEKNECVKIGTGLGDGNGDEDLLPYLIIGGAILLGMMLFGLAAVGGSKRKR